MGLEGVKFKTGRELGQTRYSGTLGSRGFLLNQVTLLVLGVCSLSRSSFLDSESSNGIVKAMFPVCKSDPH